MTGLTCSKNIHCRGGKPGFTIIEMVIVIGIMTILISLVMPVLSKSDDNAKIAVCLSNMHQLAVATNAYVSDNKDYLPWHDEAWGNGARFWLSTIADPSKYNCAAMTEADYERKKSGYDASISNWTNPKYLAGNDMPGVKVIDSPVRISMIARPAQKLFVFEPESWHYEGEPFTVPSSNEPLFMLHKKGNLAPASFTDGHAVKMDYYTIINGWYPGTSKVWERSIHGTPNGYVGRDIK